MMIIRKESFKGVAITFLLIATFNLSAQDSTTDKSNKKRIHEVGLAIPNIKDLSQVGLIYRVGSEKALWRLGTISMNGRSNDAALLGSSSSTANSRFVINFFAGREFRKRVSENFELRFGGDLLLGYRMDNSRYEVDVYEGASGDLLYTRSSKIRRSSYVPGIGMVLGFNYILRDRFVIGAEINPSAQLTYIETKGVAEYSNDPQTSEFFRTDVGLNYGFSNYNVLMSFAYRF